MATFNNEQFVTLPCINVNSRLITDDARIVLPHIKGAAPDIKMSIDEEAWKQFNAKVREERTKIWEASEFKMPLELYRQYPIFAHKNKFVVAEKPNADWLVDIGTNWIYANDAADIARLCESSIDATWFAANVQPITDKGEEKYAAQIAQFDTNYRAKCAGLATSGSAAVVEVYDDNLQLLCICPNSEYASRETGVHTNTIHGATLDYRLCQGYYFREFYDNNFCPKNTKPFEQILDGRVVNRFATVKDAAKQLDIKPFAIYRLIREPNKVDQYGCHWRKV